MVTWSKEKQITTKKAKNRAMRVSGNSIIVNTVLSIVKLVAGIIGHSSAMVSDAVHSASDVGSTFIVMIGVHLAGKESDENHPYGHERFECVAAVILAVMLAATGLGIGWSGIQTIMAGNYDSLETPGLMPLAAALLSIGVKEWMYWYTRKAAKQLDSGALMADAWHHRSDALSSVGSFAGIAAARAGFPVFDSVASLIICVLILKAAFDVFRDAVVKMTDESCDAETVDKMQSQILQEQGVLGLDEIKTRKFGNKIYVDIEISADGSQSLEEGHRIAERVHLMIEREYPKVKHCMVHVNPLEVNPE